MCIYMIINFVLTPLPITFVCLITGRTTLKQMATGGARCYNVDGARCYTVTTDSILLKYLVCLSYRVVPTYKKKTTRPSIEEKLYDKAASDVKEGMLSLSLIHI